MTIYAIGDIQGCFDQLRRLLDAIKFNEHDDKLWFVGDLVNRGPKSLETLRFIKNLGNAAVVVLGNHDLHLLAAACEPIAENSKKALTQILLAPDREALINWLRHRPLFHYDGKFALVHAGLPPQWDIDYATALAREVETVLQGNHYPILMKAMYGDKPDVWSPGLVGMDRLRFIINSFTRMRYCDKDGRLDLIHNGPPGSQPKHLMPWFNVPGRKSAALRIVFGHWSSLGYFEGNNCYAVDTGCLWGGQLTALRLMDKPERISINCPGTKN
ncbi:bis(5'-nucleosyl)-tetraphosphatase (symmetrical) [biofilm metagenome]